MSKRSYWDIIDDCEHFIAKCSNCGNIEDSRLLPNKCPKCSAIMKTGEGINSLKPCPFCGSKGIIMHTEKLIYIECRNCGCRTSDLCVEEVAIERWNRRADE